MNKCSGNSISRNVCYKNGFWPPGEAVDACKYVYPREDGSEPTVSICIRSNHADASGNATNGVTVCR